ncbi:MAG TPA: ribulose-phosphate 3-epimerase [Longimicrobiales bacterium]|nr:ribulose-phosphate 3-epimerase [Longimicrobiales bacterium]
MAEVRIAPSILSADFARLGDSIAEAEAAGADWIHVDVMDGHFVPNITIGVPVVAAIRKVTRLPLDVHLMIERPDRYVEAFVRAGADWLTVHVEAERHLHRTVQAIRQHGARAGVSLNPGTPAAALDEILPFVDLVLVMSVNPGFGGQEFIPTSTVKIGAIRAALDAAGHEALIEVDGGISPATAGEVVRAGADVLVAGAAVYGGGRSVRDNIDALRTAAAEGKPRA